ncbi:MAG TPA: hypothetical protein VF456_09625 [Vicinamibacterales bacterium]
MPLASGIVLPVAEAETLFGDLRKLPDPQARYGVPALMCSDEQGHWTRDAVFPFSIKRT